MSNVSTLNVDLYGETIGTITNVGGDRTLFAFTDAYIKDEERPTLGLSFVDETGELGHNFRPYQKRLMPFFSNLLPEGHMRKYLAERAGVNHEREFHLLWALGNDLPGAITISSADGDQWSTEDGGSPEEKHHDNALRFSLAGVQLKFSAIEGATGGLTIPASGAGGSWVVKLQSREFDGVPENEFSMMMIASMMGMNVPKIDLIDIDVINNMPEGIDQFGTSAFVIERFDRLPDGSRVQIEDFAQIFNVYAEDKYKYANIANIARVVATEGNDEDVKEFVRRVTYSMIMGNGDMHLKNWSLIYPDRKHSSLAPAYDFVSTIPYLPKDRSALNISRSKAFTDFNLDELHHFAARAAIPKKRVTKIAQETIEAFHEVWGREVKNLPLGNDVRGAIDRHLKTVPLIKELT